ncbi:MAG: hypothetical protein Q8R60_10375 [Mycobacteriales bacterium]|nr:hypothetical protein [Mycobacteriales bacterium]
MPALALALTDDRLVAAMRDLVIATNRLEHHAGRGELDLATMDRLQAERDEAGTALQEALLERGWRRPTW